MIKDLEAALGYQFHNITLLQKALTHSSYANERWHDALKSNERLEFLGDSILGMVVAENLYRLYPNWPEGDLTRLRANLVCESSLAEIANRCGLGEHLMLGHGEEQSGGRSRDSILADAVESVIAATYLDGGMDAARTLIQRFILLDKPAKKPGSTDYKTALQELVQQKKNQTISYQLAGESGPDHNKSFTVTLLINGQTVSTGIGSSKKRAEQNAAQAAIVKLFPEYA